MGGSEGGCSRAEPGALSTPPARPPAPYPTPHTQGRAAALLHPEPSARAHRTTSPSTPTVRLSTGASAISTASGSTRIVACSEGRGG